MIADDPIEDIEAKIATGIRLDITDALRLYRHPNLLRLSLLANYVRENMHPDNIVTYNIGRNINYTNVCRARCRFCNFSVSPRSKKGYVLSLKEVFEKIDELVAVGGDIPEGCELLMQGGIHPGLDIRFFEDLFRAIVERYPQVYLHSLSAPEIVSIARTSNIGVDETITRLCAAGLKSIPGGGAEILCDSVRNQIAPRKVTTEEWLSVHRIAHNLGVNTTGTMMYGSIETLAHRVEHLNLIRQTQDEALARILKGGQGGRFTAFIAWSFQPKNTRLPELCHGHKAPAVDYLKTVAVSRLFLDNIENLQASYVTQGPKVAQIALRYGLNDFGSSMMEENVVHAAGVNYLMPVAEIRRVIADAGYEPRRRNTRYEWLE